MVPLAAAIRLLTRLDIAVLSQLEGLDERIKSRLYRSDKGDIKGQFSVDAAFYGNVSLTSTSSARD